MLCPRRLNHSGKWRALLARVSTYVAMSLKNPGVCLKVCGDRQEMVQLEGETSNSLFETLEDWNTYLKAEKVELPELQNQPRRPSRRGPSL